VDELTPVGQTYLDVERFIHMLVHQAVNKWRLEYPEALSAAHLGFMQAYESYRPEKGEFLRWVAVKVENRLKDHLREVINQKKHKEVVDFDFELVPERDPELFDLDSLLNRMSEDAGEVVKQALKPPSDVKLTLAQLGAETPANYRQALREFFGYTGWSERRVRKTFMEIRSKL
jgi:hypothetical protein